MIKKVMFSIILFLCLIINVNAETTTTESVSCSYKNRAELNKLASSVTASYELKKDDNGTPYFKISIYNITEKIYVNIANSVDPKAIEIIVPSAIENGIYSFNVYDLDTIITYTFTVRSNVEGCTQDIRKFTLTKPKKNMFHDLDECKYESVLDYYYCQEWITRDFSISDDAVKEKINRERKKQMVKITTKCESCEREEELQKKKKEQIRLYIIMGLVVAIILDIIVLLIQIKNVRSANEW